MLEQWFEDKVALVTGGSDGIGRQAALLFAARGAKVAIADVNKEGGEETRSMISAAGGAAAFFETNVASKEAVAAFINGAVEEFGRIDIGFNNAGITHPRDDSWDDDSWNATLAINLAGVNYCMKGQIPHMLKAGGGAIVNTSSIHGFIANPALFLPAYTASKHAVIGLTKAAALEYAKKKIRVNALCPGVAATAMVRQTMDRDEASRKMIEGHAPMGRVADPKEIAQVAVWLASDAASFVTGHALVADGGYLAQ